MLNFNIKSNQKRKKPLQIVLIACIINDHTWCLKKKKTIVGDYAVLAIWLLAV